MLKLVEGPETVDAVAVRLDEDRVYLTRVREGHGYGTTNPEDWKSPRMRALHAELVLDLESFEDGTEVAA